MILNENNGSSDGIRLASIAIATPPAKTAYKVGETFDPTGMVVKADYSLDGVVIVEGRAVTGYTYPTGALAAGTESVTVAYAETGVTKTAAQAISVTKTDVDKPAFDETLTYNTNVQTPAFTNEPSSSIATKSGDLSGRNAGDYLTVFTLNDTGLYQWADGTTEPVEVPWSIGRAAQNVTTSVEEVTLDADSPTATFTVNRDGDGEISAESSDESVATASVDGNVVTVNSVDDTNGTATITVNVAQGTNYEAGSASVQVNAQIITRYGFRINKNDSNPATRVEYLYDAVGMTPAHMDFSSGKFDYGSWGDLWFITDNKPLMLKSDGTVDYYLDPNDYTKKADGTASDVSNTSYGGNAMAQFPLVWVYRYEEGDYEYTIFSEGQWDENYKAYAHTRMDGTIAPYFYWSLFAGSLTNDTLRSLKDQTPIASKTVQNEVDYAVKNGTLWYTHTWSMYSLINDLMVLIGKSTNTQAVFGNGFHQGSGSSVNKTGTLSDKGQFFGYNDNTHTVKVFHTEREWGQWDRIAGLINNNGPIYVKMTREGQGYRVTDVTGYTNTGVTVGGTSGGYLSATKNTELGRIPQTLSGSETTFYCDGGWFNNGQLDYLFVGASSGAAAGLGGAFAFNVYDAPSRAPWNGGAGLSCEMPTE